MNSPADQFPDNFDIEGLQDPKPETLSAFDDICIKLDDISEATLPREGHSTPHVTYHLSERFSNGSLIEGHSTHGDEEWLRSWGETMSTRNIELTTSDGISYSYSENQPKAQKTLHIKRSGEQVPREVSPDTTTIETGNGTALSARITGNPDFMRSMAAAIAEKREADKLGLSKLTDGSLKEFTAALQAALESGATEKES